MKRLFSIFLLTILFGFCHQQLQAQCQAQYIAVADTSLGANGFQFVDQSTGNPGSWSWDFGDGTTSSMQNPGHNYASNGIYQVCLTISNGGCTSSVCDTIQVPNGSGGGNCNAGFSATTSGATGTFSANVFNGNWNYYWTFGDGNAGSGSTTTHTYANAGTYWVCLYVIDSLNSCMDSLCQQVTVTAGGGGTCQANFYSYPDTNANPGNIQFIGTSTSSAGAITSYFWDFGDGTSSTLQNPLHYYASNGTYTVCLTITTGGGCTDTQCNSVTVTNSGGANNCNASLTYSANGLIVTFNGVSANPNLSYDWDFGDGNSASNSQTVTHQYAAAGTYTVCMITYSTNPVCNDTICLPITVTAPTYIISGQVFTGAAPADSGMVWLITYNPTTNILAAIDSTVIDSMGSYWFANVPAGAYRVKASLTPGSAVYASYLPTYYGDVPHWSLASTVTLGPNNFGVDINMIAGINPGGPGFIGGDVTQGANKTAGVGDPIEGVLILLFDSNGDAVAYTYTDANGHYEFDNLAYGTYTVYPEVPGIPTNPATVTISADNPSQTNIDFDVNTTNVVTWLRHLPEPVVGLGEAYPNPASRRAMLDLRLAAPETVSWMLVDPVGKIVRSEIVELQTGEQQLVLDLAGLPASLYTLTLKLKSAGTAASRKILKAD